MHLSLKNFNISQRLQEAFNRTASVTPEGRLRIQPRQIYILPTRYGWIFGIMLIVMLIGSNNYGVNLGFILTFLLAGMGLSAMLQTWRNLSELEITPEPVTPVFAGQNALFKFRITNLRRTDRPGIQIKIKNLSDATNIQGNDIATLTCPLETAKRGYLRPSRHTVFTFFPLGLFYAWAYFQTDQKCLVYPKPIKHAINLNTDNNADNQAALIIKGEEDFKDHREYQHGDNIKRLDWKALARGRGMLVKQYETNASGETWIDWALIQHSDVEYKLSAICYEILELTKALRPFGLILPHTTIPINTGKKHEMECLKVLALY